ncbi:hypothetical protein, variant [Thecamonas trahens ATCC 50062]|uniref:Uncharacterized protein n=1 Tax=Thecamonas trahens ATCC 50062 TaxID=461836 RepID=A0A0L0D6W8_THETB|nr:hypothetical protein AMSG_04304 [Thecamonas trahens ATCC 50062]XP_013759089.1 hypothetical protein, variant [Thecamonas trahens ATCC 50062]KNC48073.1 hypothetical protein, variant [Thecamonas trahens ATCC 50062]KNC48074.1 hypothetical protein AMSG_04304 [Thecamonas trahens ATCC 50062]|eukprot:XP_013759088.1 hypothetical protein AMSG_04304 [Thecamonas trahens ATCC 50062]
MSRVVDFKPSPRNVAMSKPSLPVSGAGFVERSPTPRSLPGGAVKGCLEPVREGSQPPQPVVNAAGAGSSPSGSAPRMLNGVAYPAPAHVVPGYQRMAAQQMQMMAAMPMYAAAFAANPMQMQMQMAQMQMAQMQMQAQMRARMAAAQAAMTGSAHKSAANAAADLLQLKKKPMSKKKRKRSHSPRMSTPSAVSLKREAARERLRGMDPDELSRAAREHYERLKPHLDREPVGLLFQCDQCHLVLPLSCFRSRRSGDAPMRSKALASVACYFCVWALTRDVYCTNCNQYHMVPNTIDDIPIQCGVGNRRKRRPHTCHSVFCLTHTVYHIPNSLDKPRPAPSCWTKSEELATSMKLGIQPNSRAGPRTSLRPAAMDTLLKDSPPRSAKPIPEADDGISSLLLDAVAPPEQTTATPAPIADYDSGVEAQPEVEASANNYDDNSEDVAPPAKRAHLL